MPAIQIPGTNITYGWQEREDGWANGMNTNLIVLGVLASGSVKSKSTSAPPASPSEGDAYIVPVGATGDWGGQDNKVAAYFSAAWIFIEPNAIPLFVDDEGAHYFWNGSAYAQISGTGGVSGPGASTAGEVPVYSGTQGNALGRSPLRLDSAGNLWGAGLKVEEVAGTAYSLTAADNGKVLWFTSADAVTVTLPDNATTAIVGGFNVILAQGAAGAVTAAGEGGDTVVAPDDPIVTSGAGAAVSIIKKADTVWWASAGGSGGGGGGGSTEAPSLFSNSKPAGEISSFKTEYLDLAGSDTTDVLSFSGNAGYVSSFFLAMQGSTISRTDATIDIYYDGEPEPAISMSLVDFFQARYLSDLSIKFHNNYFGASCRGSDSSYFINLPIPFNSGIRIAVTNGDPSNSVRIWSTAIIHTGVPNNWQEGSRFMAKRFYGDVPVYDTVQLIDEQVSGGRFVALWFLEDDFPGSISPNGGALEGNVAIHLNNNATPSYESSGTEDYFMFGFYGALMTPGYWGGEVGTTFFNNQTFGFWRQHIHNPMKIDGRLRIDWSCGDQSQVPLNPGTSARVFAVTYYYESAP